MIFFGRYAIPTLFRTSLYCNFLPKRLDTSSIESTKNLVNGDDYFLQSAIRDDLASSVSTCPDISSACSAPHNIAIEEKTAPLSAPSNIAIEEIVCNL